jgi:lambda family phage portal protein
LQAEAPAEVPMAALGTSQMAMRSAFGFWLPELRDADSEDFWEREDQRAYSRRLYNESPAARSGIQKEVEYRVGTGLRLQSVIDPDELGLTEEQAEEWQDRTEKRFNMWAKSPFASVEGDQSWYQMQELIAKSRALSGDIFGVLVRKERQNWPFRTAVQLIEADRVCNINNTANTETIYEGIKRAADGEIVSIFVANHHPNRVITPQTKREWREIKIYAPNGRRNVFHHKKMERPGQTRGMPDLSVVTGILKGVNDFSAAELHAANVSAANAIFATMSPESFTDIFKDPAEQQAYISLALEARKNYAGWDSGRLLNLFPGETVNAPTPGRPNPNFGTFVNDFYVQLGMGLNLSKEALLGVFESSYTAARAALQQLWQSIYIKRHTDITQVCEPVYETWLFDCVADGIIQAPGFFVDPFIRHAWSGSEWAGMGPSSLNPLDEARAAVLRAQHITSELEETMSYDGGDYVKRHRQRAREAEARRRDKLPPLGTTAAVEGPPDDGATTTTQAQQP